MARAQEIVEIVHEPDSDEAFRFGERRLLFYLSSTLANLGETTRAQKVQDDALALYGNTSAFIDPVLIQLDRAQLLITEGDFDGGVSLTHDACFSLRPDHRTPILAARVRQITEALPPRNQAHEVLSKIRQTLIASSEKLA